VGLEAALFSTTVMQWQGCTHHNSQQLKQMNFNAKTDNFFSMLKIVCANIFIFE
jgi:hypothetical protein